MRQLEYWKGILPMLLPVFLSLLRRRMEKVRQRLILTLLLVKALLYRSFHLERCSKFSAVGPVSADYLAMPVVLPTR